MASTETDVDAGAPPLAAAVRAARERLGITQADLARRAGVTASYVSRIESAAWERGGPWPSDDVLRSLARALGCSSTRLVRMKDHARERAAQSSGRPAKLLRSGSPKYAICIGDEDVLRAAQNLLERNPPRGSLRVSSQLFDAGGAGVSNATLAEVLGRRLAEDTAAVLYRMCVVHRGDVEDVRASAHRLAVGRDPGSVRNIRLRCCFAPPALFDVVVGEHEALIAVPDRAGHPHLRASLVVNDPDFVDALRLWFDDYVWQPRAGFVDLPFDRLDEELDVLHDRLVDAGQAG